MNWLNRLLYKIATRGEPKRPPRPANTPFVASYTERRSSDTSDVRPQDFKIIIPNPKPEWLRSIHLLNVGLAIVFRKGSSTMYINCRTALKHSTDMRAIIRDIVGLADPEVGMLYSSLTEGIRVLADPWDIFGPALVLYSEKVDPNRHDTDPELIKRVQERVEALNYQPKIEWSIWDIVKHIESGGAATKFRPTTTSAYDEFLCEDGVYRYYRNSGRVKKKRADGTFAPVRRPPDVPKFKKKAARFNADAPQEKITEREIKT